MSLTTDKLYELLPAIIRLRDLERGEPLRALVAVLAGQGRLVEEDLQRLYDNLFIETCDDWVVPYLGDLLGVRGLHDTGVAGFSQRARVANTLAYRRRKGTATMVEQLALDTTGWRARVVEFFELLSATQWLNHLRPHSLRTPDLRNAAAFELLDTAFDTAAHSVDVRRIAIGRGRHNLPNLGIFLWRLQSFELAELTARPAADGAAPDALGRFFIHPLGRDVPLFNQPQTETEITSLARERNVPGPLRRRPLHAELEARRKALVNGRSAVKEWFNSVPVFSVAVRMNSGGPLVPVKPEEMVIANLTAPAPAEPEVWLRPPDKLAYVRVSDGATVELPIKVAVDPVLGRLAFPVGIVPHEVRVTAAHGFPGDLGGGAYERRETVAEFPLGRVTWQAGVGRDVTNNPAKHLFNSLADAVAAWNALPAGAVGVIALLDSGLHGQAGLTLELKTGSLLLLVSAGWPEITGANGPERPVGLLAAAGHRGHVLGDIKVQSKPGSELWLDGVWLAGDLTLANAGGAGLQRLRLAHCTVVPDAGRLTVANQHEQVAVELHRCISGSVELAGPARNLRIYDSIIVGGAQPAVLAEFTPTEIQASTVAGTTDVQQLETGNSIYTGKVTVERRQTGCVRFCFIPAGSLTPRRFRCQPDLALEAATSAKAEVEVLSRLVPDFTAELLEHPAYFQLAATCPLEIRQGADDGAEMGAWRFLRQPQREANLRTSLDEYLRLGLEAGLIYVT